MIKASKSGDWSVSPSGEVVAGGITLQIGEYTLETTLAAGHSASGLLSDGGFVVLDLALTPELECEGIARDVIRAVQQARREAELDITDRIALRLTADATTLEALEEHRETLMAETLAATLEMTEGDDLAIAVEKSA